MEARRYSPITERAPVAPEVAPAYKLGQEVATREAYGTALAHLGARCPQVVAIDGDTKNSTFTERFKAVDPDRFAEGYIAEQNMVGVALGMSTEGKIPFASTFACFLTRAYDFIRMAAYLAALAPRAVRQPRGRLDRRGRPIADGARGPGDDARHHRRRRCCTRATR